jgi:eukaryotic-like serine/threonine-protein kinase
MLADGEPLAGRYKLEHPLAEGGMAEVWRATDEVLDRPVAVKIIRPGLLAQPGFAQRFAAEARILAGLRHPGIVGVHDYGEVSGESGRTAYLVMDFIDGEPLSDRLSREIRLSAPTTMAIIAQAAAALQTAHEAGVVHRDIKPANLLVRPNGEVVVVDFGVAKAEMSAGLTQTNTMLGTARYMSPEQVTGSTVTPATDVYALGAVAYECLAGTPAFDAETPVALALKHVTEEPPPLPDTVPGRARAIVSRAMAKDPADRFADAGDLAAAAKTASSDNPLEVTASMPVVRRTPTARYAAVGGALVAAAIGALVLAFGLPGGDTPPAQPIPATSPQITTGTPKHPQSTGQKPQQRPGTNPAPTQSGAGTSSSPSAGPAGSAQSSPQPAPSTSPQAPASPSPQPQGSTPANGGGGSPSPAAGADQPILQTQPSTSPTP